MSVLVRIARSSITGRFISLWYALRHPRTTTIETVERKTKDDEKA